MCCRIGVMLCCIIGVLRVSRNQRPRWPAFYPRMKRRGKGRRRAGRVVLWDVSSDGVWEAAWPPVIAGVDIRSGRVTFESELSGSRAWSGGAYWDDVEEKV